jgi:hypothetical protein
MTSPHTWNPTKIIMIQEMAKGGTRSMSWKRHLLSVGLSQHYKYLDAESDKAHLDSIDPSLVNVGQRISEVNTVYKQQDLPS